MMRAARRSTSVRLCLPLALGALLVLAPARPARAFNSEEHRLIADRGASAVVVPTGVELPWPTRMVETSAAGQQDSYEAAKLLAVGFSTNDPGDYRDTRKGVQDNSYWYGYGQREYNLQLWIPPLFLMPTRVLVVGSWVGDEVRTMTLGDLVALYGDYRRTNHCVSGRCYLTGAPLPNMRFDAGQDCFGVWPFQECGYRPADRGGITYLRNIAAGLVPPFGSAGNTFGNTAGDSEFDEAGWWGDEMLRIANVNDWHFSSAAVAWYVGMHRLALRYVEMARDDPVFWNHALHYEANGLHALTDLFCFGHVVATRGESSHDILDDRGLLGTVPAVWMENVLRMGGGDRAADGRVDATAGLPAISEPATVRDDFLASYVGTSLWSGEWALDEKALHDDFNATGATVRNLRGETFTILGDGAMRDLSPAGRAVIAQAVTTSLQSLFDAYAEREAGGRGVAEIAAAGSDFFDALESIPVFVQSDPTARFTGMWTRYAGAVDGITGFGRVPAGWASCAMEHMNGGSSLPATSTVPCATFPEATDGPPVAGRTRLGQNFPNPFNPRTTIGYALAEPGVVFLRVYDAAGRLVRVLEEGPLRAAGEHRVTWDGRDEAGGIVAAGIYLYRLEAGDHVETRRMALVR